jgi:hypothetical protein
MMKRKALFVFAMLLASVAVRAQENTLKPSPKKWQVELDLHYNAALFGHDHDGRISRDELSDELSLHLSLLRQVHPRFTVGVGTGAELFGFDAFFFPVYGTLRFRPFSHPHSSPFYLFTDLGYEWSYVWEEHLGNALMTNWGIGWEKKSKKHRNSLNLQLSFNSKRMPYTDWETCDASHRDAQWMHYLSVGIGWAW